MNIQIQGCADIRVPQQDTDSLVVAFAFDASCGKAVTETMKFQTCPFSDSDTLLRLFYKSGVI